MSISVDRLGASALLWDPGISRPFRFIFRLIEVYIALRVRFSVFFLLQGVLVSSFHLTTASSVHLSFFFSEPPNCRDIVHSDVLVCFFGLLWGTGLFFHKQCCTFG